MKKNNNSITLLFAGDFLPPKTDKFIFNDKLLDVLRDKDFSCVNLEAPLTKWPKSLNKPGIVFKREPKAIKHIKDGFFDAVSLANNHIRDYGTKGVSDTIDICNINFIKSFGAGKNLEEAKMPLKIASKGKKLTFLNYCEQEQNIALNNSAGANPFDPIITYWEIQKEKKESDYIIVIYHGGLEHYPLPLPGLRDRCKFLIDIGVDAIICHHTHVASGYEIYKNKPIFYGLGNFCFDYKKLGNIELHQSILAKLVLNDKKIEFYPIGLIYNRKVKEIQLIEKSELEDFNKRLEQVNQILSDEKVYHNYWEKITNKLLPNYYIKLIYGTGILGKTIKRLRLYRRNEKRIALFNNLIANESHREIILNMYNKWNR